ncbi:hypothetical protein AJ78_05931 [Emergomyces pasteurianus Ep9510]|uniref:SMP-30/Gluconolactonase/LRE-like region domain-containing protein n=1 Tax=Emergomyces pasteurianus Ep9510 TaxID=1447872 RepID=A0A1J9Q0D0_9EURO|nr:hypothetical protein AJ78_05931 [Emergomyces pasteurianus Ep9510]
MTQVMLEGHPAPITIVTTVTTVDTKRAATDINYARSFSSSPAFVVYSDKFIEDVIGDDPLLLLVASRKGQNDKFAHEAGVYIRRTNCVYFTSNYDTSDPRIDLYSISVDNWQIEKLTDKPGFDLVSQPNGGCNYEDKILYCAQGDIDRGSGAKSSALVLVDPVSGTAETLLDNFHGREFSSPNDVVVHHYTGDIWFTDPTYGYQQAFRPKPELPKQVYRFCPSTGQCWVVADGFDMCNGLCFSPDYTKLYITDTGAIQAHGDIGTGHNFSFCGTSPATIYVYDVIDGGTRLANRRLFAYCDNGVPDGIKCDSMGYVYSGCGDGLHVWDSRGNLVGKIVVWGTTANFCFTDEGIWMLAEEDLWLCKLKAHGALQGTTRNYVGTTGK